MTDREKVVCAIENCIGQPKCKDCPWEDCEVEHEVVNSVPYGLLRDALALLKEQEPKLVEIDGQLGGIKYGRCPKCEKGLNEEVYPHWCGFCGQAVKWE